MSEQKKPSRASIVRSVKLISGSIVGLKSTIEALKWITDLIIQWTQSQ